MGVGKHITQPGAQKLLEEESGRHVPLAPSTERRTHAVSIPNEEFMAGPGASGSWGSVPLTGRTYLEHRGAAQARRSERERGDGRLCEFSGAQERG